MYYPLQEGSLEIPRGTRVVKANIFKAKLQFPEVRGGGGGLGIFSGSINSGVQEGSCKMHVYCQSCTCS